MAASRFDTARCEPVRAIGRAWDTTDLRTADASAEWARAAALFRPSAPAPRHAPHPAVVPHFASIADPVVGLLTRLLEVCGDAERGFAVAALHARDQVLQHFLLALAVQRRLFAEQLLSEIDRAGGAARDHGTVAGALHRAWLTVAGTLSDHAGTLMLHEAERGEQVALRTYQQAMDARLPEASHAVVTRQHAMMCKAHAQLMAMATP